MIESIIVESTVAAIHQLYGQVIDPERISVEKTNRDFEGDYTLVVFPFLRISKKSPEATANELGNYLLDHVQAVSKYNVIKGFLNLVISDQYWIDFLMENSSDPHYGFSLPRHERPVVVEYSSPNTNKPLHLGHIRNNLLGYAVSEILKANGHHVIRVNLVNDRGIHICKSMLAYMKWGNGETPVTTGMKGDHLVGKYYVLFDQHYKKEIEVLKEQGLSQEQAEKQAPLIREAQEVLRKWESGDPEITNLWKTMNSWVYAGFDMTYQRLGVAFEQIYHESETYLLGKELVAEGLAKGVFYRKEDGSVWIDLTNDGLDEKLVLRADGTSVYITQDLGTAQLRYDDFLPQKMIYVVGNEQNYHFEVLKKVLGKLGKGFAGEVYHLSYGMVELPHGKMKSREGTVVDADDLMEEMYQTAESVTRALGKSDHLDAGEATRLFNMIGLGALKYFILKVDPKKNMLFDPNESIDFNGNTGPFIQYTHARIQSLLAKGISQGYQVPESGIDFTDTLFPLEKELIRQLFDFPAVVREAGTGLSPATIASYIYELAKSFNQFYQEMPVLKETNRQRVLLRLSMASFTGRVISDGMSLLGIEVPEKM